MLRFKKRGQGAKEALYYLLWTSAKGQSEKNSNYTILMKEQFKPEAQGADADLKAQLEREYLRIVEQYRRLAGKEPLPSEYGRFRDQAFERVYGKKPQVEGKIEEAREALSGAPRESEQVAEHPEFKCPGCGEALELQAHT